MRGFAKRNAQVNLLLVPGTGKRRLVRILVRSNFGLAPKLAGSPSRIRAAARTNICDKPCSSIWRPLRCKTICCGICQRRTRTAAPQTQQIQSSRIQSSLLAGLHSNSRKLRSKPDPDLLTILRSRTGLMPKVGWELYFGIPTEFESRFLLPFGINGSWPITSAEEIS